MTETLDISRPELIRTRGGRKVTELYQITGSLVGNLDGRLTTWSLSGRYWPDEIDEDDCDLILIEPQPEPVWRYGVIWKYPDGGVYIGTSYNTLASARKIIGARDTLHVLHILQFDLLGIAPSIVHPVREEGPAND